MAFSVQTNDGSVDNANAYISAATLRSYAADRGVGLTGRADAALEVDIVKATDFLDSAFKFVGLMRRDNQGTQWPRFGYAYRTGREGLPRPLLDACSKLALRVAQGISLNVDPTVDPSGLQVSSKTNKVGPLETTVAYFAPTGGASSQLFRRFPDVETGLRAAMLLESFNGGTVSRG